METYACSMDISTFRRCRRTGMFFVVVYASDTPEITIAIITIIATNKLSCC